MKTKNILITVIIILLVSLSFLVSALTEKVKDNYTYTKAICDENNFCQDHVIVCENKEVVSVSPVTGATIQHSNTWQDPREEKSEIICN
jgi:hypothetical protein